jgi:glyoxylase-like metal-dependent hydrolase (beta-lactamase superfamily II)
MIAMEPVQLGEVELTPILDGAQDLRGPIAESYPSVPPEAWPSIHAAHPKLVSVAGTWRLHVRCTLIRLHGRTILVDTGVGAILSPAWFGATGRLLHELGSMGVTRADVDTVILTHVHDDHIGGTVTHRRELAFPNARHVIQRADLEWQRQWAEQDDEDRVIFDSLLGPLEDAGALEVIDGDRALADGVTVRPAPGHTPGHQIVEVRGGNGRVLVSGDTFNHPLQIASPERFGSSDADPDTAAETRRRLLADLAADDALIAPSHFEAPFGRVAKGQDGWPVWVPVP